MAYKLLVVDDEKNIVEALRAQLVKAGYEVITAHDGEEGLEKFQEEHPDLVLLDLMMPKLNGFEVLKAIRKNSTEKWIPVVIISAKNDLDTIKETYHLEADLYLSKPCSMEQMLRGLKTLLTLVPFRQKESS